MSLLRTRRRGKKSHSVLWGCAMATLHITGPQLTLAMTGTIPVICMTFLAAHWSWGLSHGEKEKEFLGRTRCLEDWLEGVIPYPKHSQLRGQLSSVFRKPSQRIRPQNRSRRPRTTHEAFKDRAVRGNWHTVSTLCCPHPAASTSSILCPEGTLILGSEKHSWYPATRGFTLSGIQDAKALFPSAKLPLCRVY